MKTYKIMNVITQHVFLLSKDEAKRVLNSNKGLFVSVDNDISVEEEKANAKVSVANLVKGNTDLTEMNITALREFAKAQNIDLKGCGNSKEEIIKRIKGE